MLHLPLILYFQLIIFLLKTSNLTLKTNIQGGAYLTLVALEILYKTNRPQLWGNRPLKIHGPLEAFCPAL